MHSPGCIRRQIKRDPIDNNFSFRPTHCHLEWKIESAPPIRVRFREPRIDPSTLGRFPEKGSHPLHRRFRRWTFCRTCYRADVICDSKINIISLNPSVEMHMVSASLIARIKNGGPTPVFRFKAGLLIKFAQVENVRSNVKVIRRYLAVQTSEDVAASFRAHPFRSWLFVICHAFAVSVSRSSAFCPTRLLGPQGYHVTPREPLCLLAFVLYALSHA